MHRAASALALWALPSLACAMGYPPPHETPSLDADRWVYWTNRFNRMAVLFWDGRVMGLQN